MNLLITVLTLFVAALAIIPRERQLDMRVRFRAFARIVVALAVLSIIGLEYYDFLQFHIHWIPARNCWPHGLNPTNATYLVILIAVALLWSNLRFSRLTKNAMPIFRELVEELYWNESYGELFALIHTNLKDLFRIYKSDFFLSRLRRKLNASGLTRFNRVMFEDLKTVEYSGKTERYRQQGTYKHIRDVVEQAGRTLMKYLPEKIEAQQYAREIVRGIFLSPKFLRALAQTRPYLGLDIIKLSKGSFERFDFVELFIKELLRDPHSVFFREIQNNRNIVGNGRYEFPESNLLLNFFLKDIKVAERLAIYKPIGDFLLSYLNNLKRHPLNDQYNEADNEDFEKVDAWRSPLFVGVQFFNIMVTEALFQGIEWHMWLYYMPSVVERIVGNYRLTDPLTEETREFPTKYAYILYQIFSNMIDWILAVEHIPLGQANVVLNSTNTSNENGNIPKSSILALSQCLYLVLQSKHIGKSTKRSLTNMVFNAYFDLRDLEKFDGYAQVLLHAISTGKSYVQGNGEYRATLAALFYEERDEYFIKRSEEYVLDVQNALI